MDKSLNNKLKIKSTNVNLLKFVAALLVILCHAYPITDNGVDILSRYTNGACNFGGFAVGIFFFFSGLYVAKSFSRVDTIWNYFKKRIERIFPQLIIVVLLSVFVLGPITTSISAGEYFSDKSTYLYLLNAVLIPVHNLPGVFQGGAFQTVNGPLWTMPVEFACYIMLAVIVFLAFMASKKSRSSTKGESINSKPAKVLLWLAVFVFTVAFLYASFALRNDFLVSVVRPVILFTLGCLFYEYRESIQLNISFGLIALLGLVISGFVGLFSIGLMLFLPYCIVVFTLGIPQIGIDWKIFKLSYEMYLFGWPIQQVVLSFFDYNMPAFLNVVITVPVDIILAYILYTIIEIWEKGKKNKKNDRKITNNNVKSENDSDDNVSNEQKLSMKKSVMWNTFGSFFYYFCQWLMTVLVVRLSGLEDAGTLTLCISISNIWISLSSFGMHNYQASDTKDKYNFKTYLYSRYFTGGAALFACLIYLVAMGYSFHTNICVVFYFLYRFSESLEDVYYAAFQKSWRIDIPGKSMLIRGLISIVLFSGILVGTRSLAWTIGIIFVVCMLTVYLYDAKKGRIFKTQGTDRRMVKLLIIECLPLAVYTLLNTFVPMAPRLILEHLLGNVKLGIYGSIATPTVVVQMVATYVFNPFITLFAEELEKGDIKAFLNTLKKCVMWLGGISIASVIGGLLLGKIGLFVLYGAKVAKYSELLTPLIICSALIAFMWLLGGVLVAARSFRWLLLSNVLSSVTIIPLSYILEDEFDMQGASYATIISITLAIIVLCIGLTFEVARRKKVQADI